MPKINSATGRQNSTKFDEVANMETCRVQKPDIRRMLIVNQGLDFGQPGNFKLSKSSASIRALENGRCPGFGHSR